MNRRYPKSTPGALILPLFVAHSRMWQHKAKIQGRSRYLSIEDFVYIAVNSGLIHTCKSMKDLEDNLRQVITTEFLNNPSAGDKKKMSNGRVGYRFE